MCNTLFLTSFSGGRGQEKKCFLTSCKECLLHGQGQQEQPMCKYNHGKEYRTSKNPKMTPIKLSQMLFVLIAVHLFHLFQYCLYWSFSWKDWHTSFWGERKNVNDVHMFAAEVFVHEILQQEAQNFQNKEGGCCCSHFIRDQSHITWIFYPSRFRIFVTVNTYIQIRIWNLKTRRQCRLNTVLYTHLDGQAFYLQVFFSTSFECCVNSLR